MEDGRWIRRDKLAASDSTREPVTGMNGDPTKATPELGRTFIANTVAAAVAQIRPQLARGGQHPAPETR